MSTRTRPRQPLMVLAVLALIGGTARTTDGPACPRCGWTPPAARTTVQVDGVRALRRALEKAKPGTTILLNRGEYRLDSMLDIPVPDVTLRGADGDPAAVIVRGRGMDDVEVGVALSISAPRVTLADLTVGHVGFHGVQVRGERGASHVTLHNVRVVDTGQQLVKGSAAVGDVQADDGLVACSRFEYTDHAPSDYTNGIDVLGARGWIVRDNQFLRIRGPRSVGWRAGPAILFWSNSQETLVERNLVIDSYRGIALGLGPRSGDAYRPGGGAYDHRGGAIRQNVVCNFAPWADEGIEANAAGDVRIEHNTVFVEGRLPWSISVRFPQTSGWVRNNLVNRQIIFRDGATTVRLEGNVESAVPAWFVDPAAANLRLARRGLTAVDAGVLVPEILEDFDRAPRVVGPRPDAGAFEYAKVEKGRYPE